jgi:hypothetical protein
VQLNGIAVRCGRAEQVGHASPVLWVAVATTEAMVSKVTRTSVV